MNYGQVVEHLEIALIELEYASADFAQRRTSTLHSLAAEDLETVRHKMTAANRALQLALEMLAHRTKEVRFQAA